MKLVNRIKGRITNWFVFHVTTNDGFWELIETQMRKHAREVKADMITEIQKAEGRQEKNLKTLHSIVEEWTGGINTLSDTIDILENHLDEYKVEQDEHYHTLVRLQEQIEEYDTRADDQESEISELQDKMGLLDDRTPPWDDDTITDLQEEVETLKEVFRDIARAIRGSSLY